MSERASEAGGSERTHELSSAGKRRVLVAAGLLSAGAAAGSLRYFYARGLTNLYGDGIAHVESARRIFDSLTPGYPEIGTGWLPLFHLLVAPLAVKDSLWRSGLAGSLVSAAACAITAWLLFLLGAELSRGLAAGAVALVVFLLSPSMLYLASTPLTEPLALFWMVWAVLELSRYGQSGRTGPLLAGGAAAFGGTLTRYDGWFLLPFAALYVFLARPDGMRKRLRDTAIFSLLSGAGPVLWLAHNAYWFRNPLEFYNGPQSALALYARQVATTGFRYPTAGSYAVSARYYLADLALILGPWLLELAVLGVTVWALDAGERRRRAPALLLLVPFPFYVESMAHAAIPLYLPTLFPYTYYNLRYGIEMLPALAILLSFLVPARGSLRARVALAAGLVAVILAQSVSAFARGARQLPIVQEGLRNTPCKSPREQTMLRFLRGHYEGGRILVAVGEWPCLMPRLGINLRETVSQSNRKIWKQLRGDAEKYVEWIILTRGDSVDELMRAYPEAFRDFSSVLRAPLGPGGSVEIYRRREPGLSAP